jgi:hypothetical protein
MISHSICMCDRGTTMSYTLTYVLCVLHEHTYKYDNRQKYSALVESKAEQSRDLIAAEEGRLDISKALLDLKLEHSRLQVL